MKLKQILLGTVCLLLLACRVTATVYYVNGSNPTPVSPYTDWTMAATNIQDAIDVAGGGDSVLVTNGIYAFGGRVMAGDLINRVALTNAVTVQSVNGPWVTTILGAGATNGAAAVRCAWLTNGASLIGFTLSGGATRSSGDAGTLESGGGVWCASSNALVANCLILSNTAFANGGGAYQGTVKNSLISSNGASFTGGATYRVVLNNCTIVSNTTYGAASPMAMTNCILYYNGGPGNYTASGSAFVRCCTTPALAGTGNFTSAPLLFADGVHLATNSPCIGAGINVATGTDIFGNVWSNPPAVGCAEWTPAPVVATPRIKLAGDPVGFNIVPTFSGVPPFAWFWLKDGSPLQDNGHFSGTQTTNLVAAGVNFSDAGGYQFVVSNSFGMVTSAVAQLVIHCVDVNGTNPTAPFAAWGTAATNIQDAITAAAVGEVVLVTNGLYATGGKSMDGVITNRVTVDKAILVQSVNGAKATVIQGAWDATSTNGPGAVRCAWLTNNAILSGFMLRDGATRGVTASPNQSMHGGGIYGTSTNAAVNNCIITGNYASYLGGGVYRVALIKCTLTGNHAVGSGTPGAGVANAGSGGGAELCDLRNCLVTSNFADQSNGGGAENCVLRNCAIIRNSSFLNGGGVNGGTLVNCTVTANTSSGYSSGYGAAVYGAMLTNCIVMGNFSRTAYPNTNYANCTLVYCCADPLPLNSGNLDVDPQLLEDSVHLAATSPCIGAGTANVISGTDIDGQSWSNTPSIGCDEWLPTPILGSQPVYQVNASAHNITWNLVVAGQTPFSFFWTKDGMPIQDDGHHSSSGTANLLVNNFGPDDTGIYQVVVSNAFGVVTSQVAQVTIHAVDAAAANPVAPYSSWATAATTIQDAIDVAAPGEIVLVTNGIYATGGKVMAGDLTNRVALDKPITVVSVNGYASTAIQGSRDAISTNGPGAVRCAWLADGAVLSGFTLQNGATRASGDPGTVGGGGVYSVSSKGTVAYCVLTNNAAISGGGIINGTLNNSLVFANQAYLGGGAYHANLNNCTVINNYAMIQGGGTHTTIVKNGIVLNNYRAPSFLADNYYEIGPAQYAYTCTSPFPGGKGNTNVNPQFLDVFHIASTSPCRGAGNVAYASGTDLDGEAWANPPSMGCDEVIAANLTGPLAASIQAYQTNLIVNQFVGFLGAYVGRAATIGWSFGDGVFATNSGGSAHKWTNSGDFPVTFTVYNSDNPAGVPATVFVHVQPLSPAELQPAGIVGGAFQFQFLAQTNANYTIQYSTNLTPPVAWQTLQTIFMSGGGVIQINDPAGTNSARYYRVVNQ